MKKALSALILLMVICISDKVNSQIKHSEESDTLKTKNIVPFNKIETKPRFKGGDYIEFRYWLYSKVQLPEDMRIKKLEGETLVTFVIDSTGAVQNVRIIKSLLPSLDAILIETVKNSPRWKPGYVNGLPVNVRFVMPFVVRYR